MKGAEIEIFHKASGMNEINMEVANLDLRGKSQSLNLKNMRV